MKPDNRIWCVLTHSIFLLPSLAFALAGIAESTSRFHYNDYAQIERGHPSDLCRGPTKWCLALIREEFHEFENLESSFEEINVPGKSAGPYVIGRRSLDNHWLAYDLKRERLLIADPDYDKVIETWLSLGLDPPVYVNAHNTREMLTETRDSVIARWSFDLQMWFFYTAILVVPVGLMFWYLSRRSKQRYRKSGSTVFQIFSYLFLIPLALVAYIAVSSLVQIVIHNW
jgi:hypothetical protein